MVLFKKPVSPDELVHFKKNEILDNLYRAKLLSAIIIAFELLLIIADVWTGLLKVDQRFHFNLYFVMYLTLIFINAGYLFLIHRFLSVQNPSDKAFRRMDHIITIYLTLLLSWGAVVSLLDQKLYGHLIVFMVTTMTVSVLYFRSLKDSLLPNIVSTLIVFIGLPFFQTSSDVLIGHYVNLCIFIVISLSASRIIFNSYVRDFNNRILLQNSKLLLEKEIEEKQIINKKLQKANQQLGQLALIDELTGVPNRRGFRSYIDHAFDTFARNGCLLSVLMVDIDLFKMFNDTYGHAEGDHVLNMVAKQIDALVKKQTEFFCRWGGEEFIYVSFCTSASEAVTLAETIRCAVSDLKILNHASLLESTVTVSIGICTLHTTAPADIEHAINTADKAMYLAKSCGRNCVRSLPAPPHFSKDANP